MFTSTFESFLEKPLFIKALPFLAIYTMYVIGLFIDVMDVDAAQYASMAREMLETGNYLQLYNRYQDYLDKPPLLFWFSAWSFKLFGISNFSYKLPSVLFSLLGTYATYGLAKLYYGRATGYLAALVVASCQAFFLFNHDIRTDTMLTGAVIFALWQLAEFLQHGRFLNAMLGFTGIAAAMLAKGPLGLMIPALALSTDFVLKRQWRNFFRLEWLVGAVWIGILLIPMSIGLYQQFDLHPEKVMYGRTGTSGLEFFFWTQSFGRITGENVWKNNLDAFFFVHTFLWAFLPWCLLFVMALFRKMVQVVGQRFWLDSDSEAITLGGFILPFLALSTSQYKLPHYIFVLFPMAAIISAQYLYLLLTIAPDRVFRLWRGVQLFVVVVLWLIVGLLVVISFPLQNVFLWLITAVAVGLSFWFFWKGKSRFSQLVLPSLTAVIGVNLLLNSHVYPSLFRYQSPTVAARYVLDTGFDVNHFYCYNIHAQSLDFYSRHIVTQISRLQELPAQGRYWVYTNQKGLEEAQQQGLNPKVIRQLEHFHISMLTLPFLNPNTRQQATEIRYIIEINR